MKLSALLLPVLLVPLVACASNSIEGSNPTAESPSITEPSPSETVTTSQPTSPSADRPTSVPQNATSQTADLPTPDANGDYTRKTSHRTWRVVDADPGGLNCRWSADAPADWYSPSAQLPPLNIEEWEVVQRFPQGTVLTSNITPAGFATLTDTQKQPWLKVSIGPNDQICLVRANERYVQPIQP